MAEIREAQAYVSQRVKLVAFLGIARIPAQIDVGFGDVVTPDAKEIEYPILLDLRAPGIAEMPQAMAALGTQNSPMRDYYDLWTISKHFSFEGAALVTVVQATFKCRYTDIPEVAPPALSGEFATDQYKATQWAAFLSRSQIGGGGNRAPASCR